MNEPRTYILASSWRAALTWCRDTGLQPYAATTLVLTRPVATRGVQVHADDRVIVLDPSPALLEAWGLVKYHQRIARLKETPR